MERIVKKGIPVSNKKHYFSFKQEDNQYSDKDTDADDLDVEIDKEDSENYSQYMSRIIEKDRRRRRRLRKLRPSEGWS